MRRMIRFGAALTLLVFAAALIGFGLLTIAPISKRAGSWRPCDSFHPQRACELAIVTLLCSGEPPPGAPSPESTGSAE
jgi:hypothetical protein